MNSITGKKGLSRRRILILFLAIGFLSFFILYCRSFIGYQHKIAAITIQDIDFSQITDGTYLGEYDAGFIYAKVQVTVEKGKLTDLTLLEHKNDRGKAAEAILPSILEKQSLSADTISGATNSSLVIKAAIQDALYTSQTR